MKYKRQSTQGIQWVILIIVLLTLALSIYILFEITKVKKIVIPPEQIPLKEFLDKLTAHKELAKYKNINPSNILFIDSSNLAVLQSQISGLDVTYLGNYLVQYPDRIVLYNMQEDVISANIPIVMPQTTDQKEDEQIGKSQAIVTRNN